MGCILSLGSDRVQNAPQRTRFIGGMAGVVLAWSLVVFASGCEDDPPAEPIRLTIETHPPGASVVLDGERLPGFTPLSLDSLAAGDHELLMHLVGFADTLHSIALGADSNPHIAIALRAIYGVVLSIGSSGSGIGEFNAPFDVAVDGEGSIYVSDQLNHRIQVFDSHFEYASTFGTRGTGPGQFINPAGLHFDGGELFVVDSFNDRIQVFSPIGAYRREWPIPRIDQAPNPIDLTLLPSGHILVTDFVNQRVFEFSREGAYLGTWLPRDPAEDRSLFGISSAMDMVLVGDRKRDSVRRYNLDGTDAGPWRFSGSGSMLNPGCISQNAAGIVAIPESEKNRVMFYDSHDGSVFYEAGEGSDLGPLHHPVGAAWSSGQLLVVTDLSMDRIVIIRPEARRS